MRQSEAVFDDTRAATIDWDLRFSQLEDEIQAAAQKAAVEEAKRKQRGR